MNCRDSKPQFFANVDSPKFKSTDTKLVLSDCKGEEIVSILIRIILPVLIILTVSEVSRRLPQFGALLVSPPLVSILAFGAAWYRDQHMGSLSTMARVTLILVPLGIPFFVPLAFAERLGLGFSSAISAGLCLAGVTIRLWLVFSPKTP